MSMIIIKEFVLFDVNAPEPGIYRNMYGFISSLNLRNSLVDLMLRRAISTIENTDNASSTNLLQIYFIKLDYFSLLCS